MELEKDLCERTIFFITIFGPAAFVFQNRRQLNDKQYIKAWLFFFSLLIKKICLM
jgi:hypothetical protein